MRTFKADAPGRVNLIGEHTDYNGGFVLPAAIPQRTWVELTPRTDRLVHVVSGNIEEKAGVCEYTLGDERKSRSWTDYVQGVTSLLASSGYSIDGFDARIRSDVPIGSGLSSSAALNVSLFRALRAAFQLDLDDVAIARFCQRVENEFVGAHVGIMDPMACSLADVDKALFLDTLDLSYQTVPIPARAELIVINSGVSHRNVGGGYNERRSQCELACQKLGVRQLREIGIDRISLLDSLSDPLRRRARHVVTENERVKQAVNSMREGNAEKLGELFRQSHESMRDDYEVSIPEIDLLVELANSEPEVFGARLTGGGFGGSIVALAKKGSAKEVSRRIASRYQQRSGCQPTVIVPLENS